MLTWFWQILSPLNWALSLSIIILVNGAMVIAAILLIRKFVPLKDLGSHRDFTAAIFCNFGVLYAVLLAFTIFNAQTSFNDTQTAIIQESGQLGQLNRDMQAFSLQDQAKIHQDLLSYTNSILNEEWGSNKPNPITSQKFETLWADYKQLDFHSKKQSIWYNQSLMKLNELSASRTARLDSASENISTEMWSFLIFGKYGFLAFLCFFRPKNISLYLVMSFAFAGIISASLFLVYCLDTPFSGYTTMSKDPFYNILHVWSQSS